jgi:hypothetical protein
MTHRRVFSFGLFVLGLNTALLGAQSQQWVVVDVAQRERVAFVPQREPYTEGGPAVSILTPSGPALRLASGETVQGFEFIGWHEDAAIRVVVRALIPRAPATSSATQPKHDQFERRQIGTMLLRSDETVKVERLRELGVSPVDLRVVER